MKFHFSPLLLLLPALDYPNDRWSLKFLNSGYLDTYWLSTPPLWDSSRQLYQHDRTFLIFKIKMISSPFSTPLLPQLTSSNLQFFPKQIPVSLWPPSPHHNCLSMFPVTSMLFAPVWSPRASSHQTAFDRSEQSHHVEPTASSKQCPPTLRATSSQNLLMWRALWSGQAHPQPMPLRSQAVQYLHTNNSHNYTGPSYLSLDFQFLQSPAQHLHAECNKHQNLPGPTPDTSFPHANWLHS